MNRRNDRTFLRRLAIGTALGTVALTLAACNSGGSSGGGEDEDSFTIGVASLAFADPTIHAFQSSFVDYAKKQGWTVRQQDTNGSIDGMNAAIQNFVTQKVDLIVYSVVAPNLVQAGINQAKTAGIPVAGWASDQADGVQTNVPLGDVDGALSAKSAFDASGGEGDVLYFGYKAGIPCQNRYEAFQKQQEQASWDVQYVDTKVPGDIDFGQSTAQAWLAAHPEDGKPKLIVGCYDGPVIGAAQAAKSLGRKDIQIFGNAITPQGAQLIQQGLFTSDVFDDLGGSGEALAKAVPQIIENGVDGPAVDLSIGGTLIDKDNVDEYIAKYPDQLALK